MRKSITDLSSVTTVGLDLAKHVFQVHCIDALGRVIVAKSLRRKDLLAFFAQLPKCLVGLEACGSAHHWARELINLGHDARGLCHVGEFYLSIASIFRQPSNMKSTSYAGVHRPKTASEWLLLSQRDNALASAERDNANYLPRRSIG